MIYLMGPIEPEIAIGVGTVGLTAATAIITALWRDNQKKGEQLQANTREVLVALHEFQNTIKDLTAEIKRAG